MASVSHLPFYSTTYGESHGYNTRNGSASTLLQGRYGNQGFRGSIGLGRTMTKTAAPVPDAPPITPTATTKAWTIPPPSQQHSPPPPPQQQLRSSTPLKGPLQFTHTFERELTRATQARDRDIQHTKALSKAASTPVLSVTQNITYIIMQQPNVIQNNYTTPSQKGENFSRGSSTMTIHPKEQPEQKQQQWDSGSRYTAVRDTRDRYNLSGLPTKFISAAPSENFCKTSISRREDRMRNGGSPYFPPGYTGHTQGLQHKHGATYGLTTRQCIAEMKC